jgi:hypothetical protein
MGEDNERVPTRRGGDYSLNSTGGVKTHSHNVGNVSDGSRTPVQALVQANIIDGAACVAFQVGDIDAANQVNYSPTERIIGTQWERGSFGTRTGATSVVGNTREASNLPPYRAVTIWERIK